MDFSFNKKFDFQSSNTFTLHPSFNSLEPHHTSSSPSSTLQHKNHFHQFTQDFTTPFSSNINSTEKGRRRNKGELSHCKKNVHAFIVSFMVFGTVSLKIYFSSNPGYWHVNNGEMVKSPNPGGFEFVHSGFNL